MQEKEQDADTQLKSTDDDQAKSADQPQTKEETGGPSGPEPTRYGDWERKGRCIDF